MPRLTSPLGVVVNVSDEKAVRLLAEGFTPAQRPAKTTAKKAASSKKSD